jgi:hypothetical protein
MAVIYYQTNAHSSSGASLSFENEVSKRSGTSIIFLMSKVGRIKAEPAKLSPSEPRQIRGWLDDFVEDTLEFTEDFESSIRKSEQRRFTIRASMRHFSGFHQLYGPELRPRSIRWDSDFTASRTTG